MITWARGWIQLAWSSNRGICARWRERRRGCRPAWEGDDADACWTRSQGAGAADSVPDALRPHDTGGSPTIAFGQGTTGRRRPPRVLRSAPSPNAGPGIWSASRASVSSRSLRSGRSFVRRECQLLPMIRSSFPRRQQYRRLRRAAASGAAGLATGAGAVGAASVGALEVAGVLLLVTSGLVIDARRWLRLAARSRIGARSEDDVRRALAALQPEGWRLRHSLRYRGRGDIESVAIAPTGMAFAIEDPNLPRPTWPTPARWRSGFAATGGACAAAARCQSCASSARRAWSGSRTTC